jgi:hypothetical protein
MKENTKKQLRFLMQAGCDGNTLAAAYRDALTRFAGGAD